MEDLKREAPDRIEISTSNLAEVDTAQEVVDVAVSKFGKLDGLVLNHGTMGEVRRLVDGSVEGWMRTFQVNFFSIVGLVRNSLICMRSSLHAQC